jgi:hypothetical protein
MDMQKPTTAPLRPAFRLFGKPRSCHRHQAPMHCPTGFTEHSRSLT